MVIHTQKNCVETEDGSGSSVKAPCMWESDLSHAQLQVCMYVVGQVTRTWRPLKSSPSPLLQFVANHS